jgi:hypothetical protein
LPVVLFSIPDTTMNMVGWENRQPAQYTDSQVMNGHIWYKEHTTNSKPNLRHFLLSILYCSNTAFAFHVVHRKLTLKKDTTMNLVVPTFQKQLPLAVNVFEQAI